MVVNLLAIKEKIKEIYGTYDKYIIPIAKFIFAFVTILLINGSLGYMAKLKSPLVAFLIGAICAFLPSGAVVAFGAIVILGHILALSVELGAMVFVVFVVLLCTYFKFSPREGYLVALTVMLFGLKVPYLVPIIAGLLMSTFAFIPVSIGVFVHYLIDFATQYDKSIDEMTTTNIMDNVRYIIDGLLTNKGMIVFVLVFSVTIILINVIKKFSMDYAWAIASGIGVVVNIVMMIVCNIVLGAGISVLGIIFGNILALVLAVILYVMVFSGDYSRTEVVQFEDDDYYYYVKAVPKFSAAARSIKVKKVDAKKAKPMVEKSEKKELTDYEEYERDYEDKFDSDESDDYEALVTQDEEEIEVIDI